MEPAFEPLDTGYAARVGGSFARQGAMGLVGAELLRVAPGRVEIGLAFREDLSQQHGYFHAGVAAMAADSAGGYAAFSLFPADATVLTVEFKLNLLAPAKGERLRAAGRVLKSGRTLSVCELQVFVLQDGRETLCAQGLQTVMRLDQRSDS